MKIPVRIDVSVAWRLREIADGLVMLYSEDESGTVPSLYEEAEFLKDHANTIIAAANDPDPDDVPLPEPPEDEDYPVTSVTSCPPWHYLPGPYGDDIGRAACPYLDTHADQRARYERARDQ